MVERMPTTPSTDHPLTATKKRISALPLTVKLIGIAVIAGALWFGYRQFNATSASKQQYQTSKPTTGTLVVAITASGQVSTANNAQVNTQASGVVSKVYVKNGQKVKAGDPIAEIDLDLEGRQRSTAAYASYQNAKMAVETAQSGLFTTQSDMFTKWKKYMDIAQSSKYENDDGSPNADTRTLPEYISTNDDWLATEANFKIQQKKVTQAQTALTSSWMQYQQTSPVVYAPISGSVTGFSLEVGSVLTAQSNANGGASSQKIASIKTDAPPSITLNITEIDAPKVKVGNTATVTLDAFPGKTYTGSVVSVDTVGAVSSGVTTYPTVIKLDNTDSGIFTNMGAQANIIIETKDNVLLVPNAAVQSTNGETTVKVLRNGVVTSVPVEIGSTSDSQTEITAGLTTDDSVVIGSAATGTSTSRTGTRTQSPFGSFGGMRMPR